MNRLTGTGENVALWSAAATVVLALGVFGSVLAHVDAFAVIYIVENVLLGLLTVLIAAEAGLLASGQRITRRLLAACAAILCCMTVAWEIDRLSGGRGEVLLGDFAALLGWAAAAFALRHCLKQGLIEGAERRVFLAVFLAHSTSVVVDLLDEDFVLLLAVSPRLMEGICEALELAFMGGYAFCLALLASKAWHARLRVPAKAGLGVAVGGSASPRRHARGEIAVAPSNDGGATKGVDSPVEVRAPGALPATPARSLSAAFVDPARSAAGQNGAGRDRFEALCAFGIEPHHRVVDYGCGSLRVGEHFIRYLEPRRYIGLDINEALLRSGLNRLDPALVEAKAPTLAVIRDRHIRGAQAMRLDWVVCTSVLMHVPPRHLGSFLDRICTLASPATRLLITFDQAEESQQIGTLTWAHPDSVIVREVRRRLPRRPVSTRVLEDIDVFDGREWSRALMVVGPLADD